MNLKILIVIVGTLAGTGTVAAPTFNEHGRCTAGCNYFEGDSKHIWAVENYHLGPAKAKLADGRVGYAMKDIEFMLRHFPNNPNALMLLDDAAKRLEQPNMPARYFKEAIAAYPEEPMTYVVHGMFLQKRGKTADAIGQYERAVSLNPNLPDAHYNLGLALVQAKEAESGRRIGVIPELKHPTYLLQDGFDTVQLLLTALAQAGYGKADDRIAIQSFDIAPLKRLDRMSDFALVQLVAGEGGPADEPGFDYAAMLGPNGLAEVAQYADILAPDLRLLFTPEGAPTGLIDAAHDAGLRVFAWTLRKENAFLPPMMRRGASDAGTGDVPAMVGLLRQHGVDGVFTDNPAPVLAARAALE